MAENRQLWSTIGPKPEVTFSQSFTEKFWFRVQVMTNEGATGVYTETSEIQVTPAPGEHKIYLPLIMRQYP